MNNQDDATAQQANLRRAQKELEQARDKYQQIVQSSEGGDNDLNKPLLQDPPENNPEMEVDKMANQIMTIDGEQPPKPATTCAQTLSCFKILIIVSLVIYLWVINASDRYESQKLL